METDNNFALEKLKFEHQRLWDYFEYHAKQRLDTFRFFVIFATVITSASLALFARVICTAIQSCNQNSDILNTSCIIPPGFYIILFIGIGVVLFIFSYLFQMLDERNYLMIETARKKLINLECNFKNSIFEDLENKTKAEKLKRFSDFFSWIFGIFGFIGIILILSGLIMLILNY